MLSDCPYLELFLRYRRRNSDYIILKRSNYENFRLAKKSYFVANVDGIKSPEFKINRKIFSGQNLVVFMGAGLSANISKAVETTNAKCSDLTDSLHRLLETAKIPGLHYPYWKREAPKLESSAKMSKLLLSFCAHDREPLWL